MEIVVLRSFERILVVLIGGLSIYLGYLLFKHMPEKSDSQGKIVLPGGISVFLTRVGPGVFFALFGTFVVGASFYFTVTVQMTNGTKVYSGFGEQLRTSDVNTSRDKRADVQHQIAFLNKASPFLYEAFSETQRDEVDHRLRSIKLNLIQSVWGNDWGDLTMFRAWAKFNTAPPDSIEFKRARLFYENSEGDVP